MGKEFEEPKILLDADVIRNFISGGAINKLAKIFPNRLCILDIVKNELLRSKSLVQPVNDFITNSKIEEIIFPDDNYEILFEYSKLQSEKYGRLGDGESACLAVARFEKKYIASSNLKDIILYCKEHKIKNYPTFEILHEAKIKGIMTEKEIDTFINTAKSKGRKLPYDSYKEFLKEEKGMIV
jgi:heterodisulfide reductase subunit A-like polyferredoxin